jgi:hypothetical protein
LTPKPSLGATSRGYSIAGESGAALDHQIIYGEVRVGGVRVYDASTGDTNKFLHRIIAFAGHEVQGYQQIYLNDEVVTLDVNGNVTSPSRYNGFVRIKRYFGTTAQTADPDLVAETAALTDGRWTTDHRLQGIAYLYIRFQYNAEAFPNGLPTVSATIRGKKVFDPRTSTTAWSDNPALCLRDYIASDYGLAQPSGSIEDNLVEDAADWCDDVVDSQKRYTCNGNFVTSFEPSQILSDMLTSMGGLLWYSQGKWRMKAAKYTTPTITLDENDLRSGISLSTRHSRRSNFNTVKGKFKGAESDWQEADYPVVSDPAFVTADNNLVNTLDFSLPFTTSSKTAQRIANIALRRNREQLTFSASFGLKAFQVDVGDFVYVNNTRFGWSNKAFEVTNWTFGLTEGLDLQVQMTLREISSAVFTDEAAAVFESNNTTLYDFRDVPPVNLYLEPKAIVSNQQVLNSIVVTTNTVRPIEVDFVEIQYRVGTESEYKESISGELGITEIPNLEYGESYVVRARAVNLLGIRGPWTEQVVALWSTTFAVSNLGQLSTDVTPETVHVEWPDFADPTLSHFVVRHTPDLENAAWADATTELEKVSRPATSVAIPSRSGTYMFRGATKNGKVSPEISTITLGTNDVISGFASSTDVTESPTFSGVKTNTSVVSSTLRVVPTSIIVNVIDDPFGTDWFTDTPSKVTFPRIFDPVATFTSVAWVNVGRSNTDFSFWQDVSDSAGFWTLTYKVLRTFGANPFPDDYLTVSMGNSGDIPLPSSEGYHKVTLNISTPNGRITFKRNLAVQITELQGAPSSLAITDFELVRGPFEYSFNNSHDLGSVKQAKVTAIVDTTRISAGGDTWDTMQGPWDTWTGYWDDWTGSGRPSDTDVVVYYRKSTDNTNWSEWQKFKTTRVYTRYLQFKCELKTDRPNKITPAINTLKVKVEYT